MIFNLIMFLSLCLGMFCLYIVVDSIGETFHRALAKEDSAKEVFLIIMSLGWLISISIIASMKYLFWLVKGGI